MPDNDAWRSQPRPAADLTPAGEGRTLNLFTPRQCQEQGRCFECGFAPVQGHRDTCSKNGKPR